MRERIKEFFRGPEPYIILALGAGIFSAWYGILNNSPSKNYQPDVNEPQQVYSNKVRKKIEFPEWYIEEKVKKRASKLDDLTRGDPEK